MSETIISATLERDLLLDVLDQDSVRNILLETKEFHHIEKEPAWRLIQRMAARGELRAYRGTNKDLYIDLTQCRLEDVANQIDLFVEPTPATHARLRELGDRV